MPFFFNTWRKSFSFPVLCKLERKTSNLFCKNKKLLKLVAVISYTALNI